MNADFAEGAEEGGNVRWLLGLPIQTAHAGPNHEGTPVRTNGRTLRFLRWLLLPGWVEQEVTDATETKFRVSHVSPVSHVSDVFRVFPVLAPPAPLRGQTREWPPGRA